MIVWTKKRQLIGLLALVIFGCSKVDEPKEKSQMLLFIVDYKTEELQAGATLEFEKISIDYSNIPIDIDTDPPENDLDGSVSLYYDPTQEKIFEGILNTDGRPQVLHPPVIAPSDFYEIENSLSFPTYTSLQDIDGPYSEDFDDTWNAINNLGITEIFINNEAFIGRFLYKPSESVSDNWKWIILLYRQ